MICVVSRMMLVTSKILNGDYLTKTVSPSAEAIPDTKAFQRNIDTQ